MMLGTLIGGWLAARSIEISLKALESDSIESDFYKAKLISSKFFILNILPKVNFYAEVKSIFTIDQANRKAIKADLPWMLSYNIGVRIPIEGDDD